MAEERPNPTGSHAQPQSQPVGGATPLPNQKRIPRPVIVSYFEQLARDNAQKFKFELDNTYKKSTNFALSEFTAADVEKLKTLVRPKFPRIEVIDFQKPEDYKELSFTQQEILELQKELDKTSGKIAKTLSAKFMSANKFNGQWHYKVMDGGINDRADYSIGIDRDGNVSGHVDKFDKAALEKMIEALHGKMEFFQDPKPYKLALTGSPKAIKVMEDKCTALGIQVANSNQKTQQTTLSANNTSTPPGRITPESQSPSPGIKY